MAVFNLKRINKRILIVIPLIIVLISSLGGIFLWLRRETPPEKWEEAEYSKPEDYVVKETPEGRIVENKKAGLSFKIPEGWRMEKPDYPAGQIRLYSEEAEEKSLAMMEQGCRLMPIVTYIKASIGTIESNLKESHKEMDWLSLDEYEITEVGGFKALKNTLEDSSKFNIYHVGIYVSAKNKLYSFELTASLKDKEKCRGEFEQFLKTVSIE